MEDYKVRDLSQAEFGRKEISIAESEMPGLMALREEYAGKSPLKGAKISRSGRDIVEMLMRDIRMAGFKYRLGTNTLDFPTTNYLQFISGDTTIALSHDPIIIEKNAPLGFSIDGGGDPTPKHSDDDKCCDRIHIVYDDFNQNDVNQPYKRYKITYYAAPVGEQGDLRYAVYKTVQSLQQNHRRI